MKDITVELTDLNIRKSILRYIRETNRFSLFKTVFLYGNKTYNSYLLLCREHAAFPLYHIVKHLKLQSLLKVIMNPKHEYYKKLTRLFGEDKIDDIVKHACEIYIQSMNSLTYEIFEYGLKTLTEFDKEDRRRLTRIEQREMYNMLHKLNNESEKE